MHGNMFGELVKKVGVERVNSDETTMNEELGEAR